MELRKEEGRRVFKCSRHVLGFRFSISKVRRAGRIGLVRKNVFYAHNGYVKGITTVNVVSKLENEG